MKVETKFNLNNRIWVWDKNSNTPVCGKIINIRVECSDYNPLINVIYCVVVDGRPNDVIASMETESYETQDEILKRMGL